jgi:hypothetical protein
MMFASLQPFLDELDRMKIELFPTARLETVYSRLDRSSLRLVIAVDIFIDIYFNAENGRFDFTLLKAGKRVFGYDNLKNWHYHPVEQPDAHVKCTEPSLKLIFEETARVARCLDKRLHRPAG